MKPSIALVLFNSTPKVDWQFGEQIRLSYTTNSLLKERATIANFKEDYILFWNEVNSLPDQKRLEEVLNSKGNLWHIGTAIGLNNYPKLLNSIQPTNMHHLLIKDVKDHSNWKVSFQAMLIKKDIFKLISIPNYSNSLDIIALDFGYNAIKKGVITRFSKKLSENIKKPIQPLILKQEELFFIKRNFDKKAYVWSYLANFLSISPLQFYKGFKNYPSKNITLKYTLKSDLKTKITDTSIVIATLERYSVLTNLLKELSLLELKPKEIIIVDQTSKEKRSQEFLKEFSSLPIIYIETEKVGQCSSRNLGIKKAKNDFIWFLDDDMAEVPKDYLNRHFQIIYTFNADVSCGIPDENGTDFQNRTEQSIYLADGLPAGDVVIKRSLLNTINGFDEKMDRLKSEDQELGLRLLKQGALMLKSNQLRLLHLRASRGGLRNHKVRKVTFSSSRNAIFERNLLHFSEIYLNLKHFSKQQVKQLLVLSIRGTFIVRGSIFKKLIKVLVGLLVLPHTVFILYKNYKKASQL